MDVLQFVYPVIERYLNYVPFWTTVIGNSLKILMQVFVWTLVHFSWIYIYITGNARSYGIYELYYTQTETATLFSKQAIPFCILVRGV